MHFVAEQYINSTRSFGEILNDDASGNPTIEMIKELRQNIGLMSGSLNIDIDPEAFQRFNKVYLQSEQFANHNQEKDKHLLFLFYGAWALLACRIGRFEDTLIICERSRDLLRDPPAIFQQLINSSANFILNNLKMKELSISFIVANFDSSPRFLLVFLDAILEFARKGLGDEIEPLVKRFVNKNINKTHRRYLLKFRLCNQLEVGQLEGSYEMIQELKELYDVDSFEYNVGVGFEKLLYKFIDNNLLLDDIYQSNLYDYEKHIFASNLFLMEGDIKKALLVSTKIDIVSVIRKNSLFLLQSPIRLKLSNKEPLSAESILQLKINKFGAHYLDDLSWSRIALLNGDEEKSSLHFNRVYAECKRRNALSLLDLELEMACELEHGQIRKLMAGVFHKKKSKVKIKVASKDMHQGLCGIEKLIGNSPAIREIKIQIKKIADINMPVLIMGETGVGKDVVATALHESSKSAKEPFMPINCGALLETLLLSELHGHEAGAFTGAIQDKKGIFESSGRGAVFLDEFGEVSEMVQVALLRTLESGKVRPVGSTKLVPYHCRVIVATNKNIEVMVQQKKFREDLYYRINTFVIEIPPLRDRPEDILPLLDFFLNKHGKSVEKNISKGLLTALKSYHWPGNVRELKNETDKMCLIHLDKEIFSVEEFYVLKELIGDQKVVEKEIEAPKLLIEKELSEKDLGFLDNKIKYVLGKTRNARSRIKLLKEAFRKCSELTRQEVIGITDVSPATASNDLKALIKEGFIKKIKPTPAPRTHYFKLIP